MNTKNKVCKNCSKIFQASHHLIAFCSDKCRKDFTRKRLKKYYWSNLKKERKRLREWRRQWRKKNPQKAKMVSRKYWAKVRSEAFRILSKGETPKCANCGCDNLQVLEIAHINHDGNLERRLMKTHHIDLEIIKGRRKISDLKILCRLCNVKEDIEHRFGEKGFKIIWTHN